MNAEKGKKTDCLRVLSEYKTEKMLKMLYRVNVIIRTEFKEYSDLMPKFAAPSFVQC